MSNIITDIVDEIQIKPSKSKLVLKWVVRVALVLISGAFVVGQIKVSRQNKMNDFEKSLNNNTNATIELKREMKNRIDKVYADGYKAFDDFQQFNKKQLILVLDYGQINKELLKKILELNTIEKTKSVENQLEQAKNETNVVKELPDAVNELPDKEFSIKVIPKSKPYRNLIVSVLIGTTDSVYSLIGATKEYINSLDRNKYKIGGMIENNNYLGLCDVTYTIK